MTSQITTSSVPLRCGDRVCVCDDTLQAFYGIAGTVVQIRRCPHQGHITRVDVRMDDVPASEGVARFYPHELSLMAAADRAGVGTL